MVKQDKNNKLMHYMIKGCLFLLESDIYLNWCVKLCSAEVWENVTASDSFYGTAISLTQYTFSYEKDKY